MDGVGERSERRRERQGTGVHLVTLASRRSRPLSLYARTSARYLLTLSPLYPPPRSGRLRRGVTMRGVGGTWKVILAGLHFFHFLFLCLNFPDIIAAASRLLSS